MNDPKKLVVAFLLLAYTTGAVYGGHLPPHPVISQVQVAGEEFVELYNPTDRAVDLTGWYWCYFTSTMTGWEAPHRKRGFPAGARIPPKGFYLIQVSGVPTVTADWSIGYRSSQLSDTSGTVAIFRGSPSAETLVDAVGWGKDVVLREGSPAPVPRRGESITRRFVSEVFAPCQDTDDNGADFTIQSVATPRNSCKAVVMIAAPEAASGAFGETICYTISLKNLGTENGVLSILAQDRLGWQLSLSTNRLLIAPGQEVQLHLYVTLPKVAEFVAIDLETTGLNPAEHEIIEIAWVRFERGVIVESFSSLVCPKQPIPHRITELTGISDDEVASAPSIEEVLPEVLEALSGRTVVAHNASFDRGFLETAASRMGLAVMDVAWVDSLEAARRAWPGLASYSLSHLRQWLGLPLDQEHRALADAEAAGQVWLLALQTGKVALTNVITVSAYQQATSPCAITKVHVEVSPKPSM